MTADALTLALADPDRLTVLLCLIAAGMFLLAAFLQRRWL